MISNSFVWGDDGKAITPDEAKRRREIAMAMVQAGTANKPIQHWTQGAANVAQALMGAYDMRQIDKQEVAAREASKASDAALLSAMGGNAAPATMAPAAPPSGGVATPPGNIPQGMRASPELVKMIEERNAQANLPAGYLARTAQIESGMNPAAKNPNSSASGLFQFIDSTRRQYGNFDPMDPAASTEAAAKLAANNRSVLAQALGREPSAAELYLAHQQGAGGASKLLANPSARAVDIVGADAVRLNGGNANMTAGEFANKWIGKFGNAAPAVFRPNEQTAAVSAEPAVFRPGAADAAITADPAILRSGAAPQPAGAPASPQAAPTPAQRVAQANPALLSKAMERMNDPYASPGSRAVAQALVQRLVTQEAQNPLDVERKQLELQKLRNDLANSGLTRRQQELAIKKAETELETGNLTPDQRELGQINKERSAANLPALRMDEWKLQKGKANATTVNIGQDGQQYGNPGDGLVWQRDAAGKVVIDERGAPVAIPYRGGKMFVDDQKRADAKAEQTRQKANQADLIMQDIDRTIGLLDTATIPTTGGIGALAKNIPGTAAADMSKILDGIKANIGFDKLAEMRAASPTGAALGSVTEKELAYLQSVVGSLDQSQSPQQFRFNLLRLKNAYLDTVHGVGKGPPREKLPDVPGVKQAQPSNLTPNEGKVLRYNPQTGALE